MYQLRSRICILFYDGCWKKVLPDTKYLVNQVLVCLLFARGDIIYIYKGAALIRELIALFC